MSQEKPLPFQYQFAAGAVAGVSEVSTSTTQIIEQEQFADTHCPQILVM